MSRRILLLGCVVCLYASLCSTVEGMNPCSASRMRQAYNQMRTANCKNCDKYFHCKGNYNAVYTCNGPLRDTTARTISDARERFGGNHRSSDSAADQVANEYGRRGGNCESRYLTAVQCYWKPASGKCQT